MKESKQKQAYVTSLRMLEASPKSCSDLKKKLEKKLFSEDVISKAFGLLKSEGVLDDFQYATDLFNKLISVKRAGKHKISYELKKRGIPEAIINALLESINSENETKRAVEIAGNKWEQLSSVEKNKRKKKLYDFLLRKGFDFEVIQNAVHQTAKQ